MKEHIPTHTLAAQAWGLMWRLLDLKIEASEQNDLTAFNRYSDAGDRATQRWKRRMDALRPKARGE